MNVILIALKLLPVVLQFVHMAESVFPQQGAGPSKQRLVLDTLTQYLAHVPALASRAEEIKAAVVPMINTGVALLNAFGWGRAAAAVQAAETVVVGAVDTLATATGAGTQGAPDVAAPAAPAPSHWDDAKAVGSGEPGGAAA